MQGTCRGKWQLSRMKSSQSGGTSSHCPSVPFNPGPGPDSDPVLGLKQLVI
jgi:hypothetical protein